MAEWYVILNAYRYKVLHPGKAVSRNGQFGGVKNDMLALERRNIQTGRAMLYFIYNSDAVGTNSINQNTAVEISINLQ